MLGRHDKLLSCSSLIQFVGARTDKDGDAITDQILKKAQREHGPCRDTRCMKLEGDDGANWGRQCFAINQADYQSQNQGSSAAEITSAWRTCGEWVLSYKYSAGLPLINIYRFETVHPIRPSGSSDYETPRTKCLSSLARAQPMRTPQLPTTAQRLTGASGTEGPGRYPPAGW